jgi:hypothetical protein
MAQGGEAATSAARPATRLYGSGLTVRLLSCEMHTVSVMWSVAVAGHLTSGGERRQQGGHCHL